MKTCTSCIPPLFLSDDKLSCKYPAPSGASASSVIVTLSVALSPTQIKYLKGNAGTVLAHEKAVSNDVANDLHISDARVTSAFTVQTFGLSVVITVVPDPAGANVAPSAAQAEVVSLFQNTSSLLGIPSSGPASTGTKVNVTTTSAQTYKCNDGSWSKNCASTGLSATARLALIIGLCVGVPLLIAIVVALCYYRRNSKKNASTASASAVQNPDGVKPPSVAPPAAVPSSEGGPSVVVVPVTQSVPA